MCGYFCIGFIDFIRKGKGLLDFVNLFSPNEYEKNDKKTKIFSITKNVEMKKLNCLICGKYRKFEKPIKYL